MFTFSEISPLDMLALLAENEHLKQKLKTETENFNQKLAQQVLVNENLRRQNSLLSESIEEKKHCAKTYSEMTVDALKENKDTGTFKYYTGFCYDQFLSIFSFLVPNPAECPIQFPRTITSAMKLTLKNQLLMTLIKLRLNFQFKHLGNLFGISSQDAGAIFRQWINYMYFRFGSVSIWPDRETIKSHMPPKYKEDFPTAMVILDGTELKLEKPSSLRSQSQVYSDYKSCTTLKGLLGIDPRGSFIFISTLFSGSISDKEISMQGGLYNVLQQLLDAGRLKAGDGVMVDKGFLIKEEIENLGLKLFIPPFAPGVGQMSPAEVSLTKKIAKHRVHVERAISRAKKFKIVDNRIEISLFPSINQIWFCCCFLTGFMPFLIND